MLHVAMFAHVNLNLHDHALVSLLRLCLLSTTFCVPGTTMGSVVVANIVMEHIEDLALSMSPVPIVF